MTLSDLCKIYNIYNIKPFFSHPHLYFLCIAFSNSLSLFSNATRVRGHILYSRHCSPLPPTVGTFVFSNFSFVGHVYVKFCTTKKPRGEAGGGSVGESNPRNRPYVLLHSLARFTTRPPGTACTWDGSMPLSCLSKSSRCRIPPVSRKTRLHSAASSRSPGRAYLSVAGSTSVNTT